MKIIPLSLAALASASCLSLSAFGQTQFQTQTESSAKGPATTPVAPVTVPGATTDVGISARDGITVSGVDVLLTSNGVTRKLDHELTLPGDLRVLPNGTVMLKDGSQFTLRADQVLGLDGQLLNARVGVGGSGIPATPSTTTNTGGSAQNAAAAQGGQRMNNNPTGGRPITNNGGGNGGVVDGTGNAISTDQNGGAPNQNLNPNGASSPTNGPANQQQGTGDAGFSRPPQGTPTAAGNGAGDRNSNGNVNSASSTTTNGPNGSTTTTTGNKGGNTATGTSASGPNGGNGNGSTGGARGGRTGGGGTGGGGTGGGSAGGGK